MIYFLICMLKILLLCFSNNVVNVATSETQSGSQLVQQWCVLNKIEVNGKQNTA